MNIICIDFESYYSKDFSLSKLTTEAYVRDPRFEVIGVGVKVNYESSHWFSGEKDEIKSFLSHFDWANSVVLAHNTSFDATILSWYFGITPKGWLDTMCMARVVDGVDVSASLAACAERHKLQAKGDAVLHAMGKRRKDFTADEIINYGAYCLNDVELTRQLFDIYAKDFPIKEIKLIDLTLRMGINPRLFINVGKMVEVVDEIRNKKNIALMQAKNVCHEIGEQDMAIVLKSNQKFAKLLEAMGIVVPTKISPITGKETPALAKTDEGLQLLLENEDDRVRAVVEARLATKSSIEETRAIRLKEIGERGPLPVTLKYAGARTYRWSADGATNMQNLPRTSRIKECIEAPQSLSIVGADLSNIELRVGLWIAKQMDALERLQTGTDLYKEFASIIFNKSVEDITKEERFVGKTSQLSLIYGTGHVKLQKTLKTLANMNFTTDFCKGIVDAYRNTYQEVARVWRDANHGLAALGADYDYEFGNDGIGKIRGAKGMLLPSGLYMKYPGIRQSTGDSGKEEWYYDTRQGKDKMYGAKLFQGLTQAVARCVIGDQLLALDKLHDVVLTVHDSVYILAKDDDTEKVLQDTLAIMRTAPTYLPGIVLDAEASVGKNLLEV